MFETNDLKILTVETIGKLGQIFGILGDSFARNLTVSVGGMLPDFEAQGKKVDYALQGIKEQVGHLATNGELLENANQTNRLLGPQFYDERIIQPMVRSLFPVADMIRDGQKKMAAKHSKAKVWRSYFAALRVQLDQFLDGYGIEAFEHAPDSPFDPKVMKPLQTTPTDDEELDGLVAESLQCGFRTPEQILRTETVSLYKFENFEKFEDGQEALISA